jgi:DNA recombination protein RmuC
MPDTTLIQITLILAAITSALSVAALLAARGSRATTEALRDRLREQGEALQRQVALLDQGLRQELAAGLRSGLSEAFDKVQAGQSAQAEQFDRFSRAVREGNEAMQLVMGNFRGMLSETVDRAAASSEASLKGFSERLAALEAQLRTEQEQLRTVVGTRLDEMRAGNEAKLEEMRKAVDEKLQSALEKQLKDSFTSLQEQLGAVQQAIGQVQTVAGEVGDLKRLFSNVKSRGGWGEAQLEAMLTDILPVGAFEKNFRVKEASAEAVEFAIRVPFRGGDHAWLPIDSKFPTEDYARLIAANEAGLREDERFARDAIAARIRLEAKRIDSKYILTPKTLEFGVLYVPSDSLFAEIARVPGLIEGVRRDNHVMVMGPSLLPAFLHTIRVSYFTVALEQRASEIGETLSAVKVEWERFGVALTRIKNQAATLSNGIQDTLTRQNVIGRKLKGVTALDEMRSERILGLDAPLAEAAAEDEG